MKVLPPYLKQFLSRKVSMILVTFLSVFLTHNLYSSECTGSLTLNVELVVYDCTFLGEIEFLVNGAPTSSTTIDWAITQNSTTIQSGTTTNNQAVLVTGLAIGDGYTLNVSIPGSVCSYNFNIFPFLVTAVGSGPGGCSCTNQVMLTVATPPIFAFDTYTYTIEGPNNPQQSQTTSNSSVTFGDLCGDDNSFPGHFQWTVTTNGPCVTSQSGVLGLPGGGPTPEVQITGDQGTYINGATITLTADVTNIPNPPTLGTLVYQWTAPNRTLPDDRTVSFICDVNDTGNYSVTVTYNIQGASKFPVQCSATSNPVAITVNPFIIDSVYGIPPCPPASTTDGSAVVNLDGGATPFTGYYYPTATTKIPFGPISTSSWPPSFTIPDVPVGNYVALYVLDNQGEPAFVEETPTLFTVGPPVQPPSVTNIIDTCPDESIGDATASFSGGTQPYIGYSINTSGFIPFPPCPPVCPAPTQVTLTGLQGGQNTVGVYDANGCFASYTFTVPTQTPPTITGFSLPQNFNFCNSGSPTLEVYVSGTGFTYSWTLQGDSEFSSDQQGFALTQPGYYTVTVSNGTAPYCSSTASINITDTLSVDISAPGTIICPGGSVTLTAMPTPPATTQDPYIYSWTGPVTSNQNFVVANQQGTYTVSVSDTNSQCPTAQNSLTIYEADFTSTPTASGNCDGSVVIKGTVSTSGIMVSAVSGEYEGSTTSVSGGNFTITIPNVAPATYTFTLYTYDYAVNQCSNSTTVQVTVSPTTLLNISSVIADCSGNVFISGTSNPGATIQAMIDSQTGNTDADDNGNFTVEVSGVSNGQNQQVTVTATDTSVNPCPTTVMTTVSVGVAHLSNLSASADCNGTVTVTGNADVGDSIEVTVANIMASGTATNGSFSIQIQNVPNGQDQTVSVTATNSGGTTPCSTMGTTTVTVAVAHLSNVVAAADCNGNVVVTGNADAGDTIEVTVDSQTVQGTAMSDGSFKVVVPFEPHPTGTATVTASTPQCSVTENNIPILPCDPYLVLSKCTKEILHEGDKTVIQLSVSNTGRGPAQNLIVTDVLPDCFEFIEAKGCGWTITHSGQTVRALYPILKSGQTALLTIKVRVKCCNCYAVMNQATAIAIDTNLATAASVSYIT